MANGDKDGDEDEPSAREPATVSNATTALGPLLRAANASSAVQAPPRKPPRASSAQPRLPGRGAPEDRARELAARKRVAGLVSGGLHFKIKREASRIQGQRGAGTAKLAARLASKGFAPEVTLDLRAKPADDAGEAIATFVRAHHRRGVRQLSISFDPTPGEDPDSMLEAIIAALTRGPVAELVRGFSSAHESLGGDAVLTVLLI